MFSEMDKAIKQFNIDCDKFVAKLKKDNERRIAQAEKKFSEIKNKTH